MATITADLSDNERLSINRVDPQKNLPIPPYFNMGRAGTSRHSIKGMDATLILSTLKGKSSWFFWFLATHRDYETNLCKLGKLMMSPTEKARIPRAYNELADKMLVVRCSKGVYLINPKIILPDFATFERTWNKWVTTCNDRGMTPEFPKIDINAVNLRNLNGAHKTQQTKLLTP